MNEGFVSRNQLNKLPERIRKAQETDATKELNLYMWHLYQQNAFKPLNILVVGAGGSYPAALFAKHAIHDEMRTPNVEAVTPQTAIKIMSQYDYIVNCDWHPKYDLVISISYSGKTPDIKAVFDLCVKKHYPFALLTGAEKSTLSEVYQESDSIKIISYFNAEDKTGREKGMISMASTLAPIVILDDNWTSKLISDNQKALSVGQEFVSKLNIAEIAKSLKKAPIIHVFCEWSTLPAAMDIESKFTESGIANVVLHEKKNFSHGRTTLLYAHDFAMVINLTKYTQYWGTSSPKRYKNAYDKMLAEFLAKVCEDKSAHYLEIGSVAMMPTQWNIEAMTKFPYLITAIGEELGIDISKPLSPYPKEVLPLYEYEGKF